MWFHQSHKFSFQPHVGVGGCSGFWIAPPCPRWTWHCSPGTEVSAVTWDSLHPAGIAFPAGIPFPDAHPHLFPHSLDPPEPEGSVVVSQGAGVGSSSCCFTCRTQKCIFGLMFFDCFGHELHRGLNGVGWCRQNSCTEQ